MIKQLIDLHERAIKAKANPRKLRINFKNLKETYLYQRFSVDSSCGLNCSFTPAEEKEIKLQEVYPETLILEPYSLNLIILKRKPKEPEVVVPVPTLVEVNQTVDKKSEASSSEKSKSPATEEVKNLKVSDAAVAETSAVPSVIKEETAVPAKIKESPAGEKKN